MGSGNSHAEHIAKIELHDVGTRQHDNDAECSGDEETLAVSGLRERFDDGELALFLPAEGVLDFLELDQDNGRSHVTVGVGNGEDFQCLVKTTLADEPTGRLGDETKDDHAPH